MILSPDVIAAGKREEAEVVRQGGSLGPGGAEHQGEESSAVNHCDASPGDRGTPPPHTHTPPPTLHRSCACEHHRGKAARSNMAALCQGRRGLVCCSTGFQIHTTGYTLNLFGTWCKVCWASSGPASLQGTGGDQQTWVKTYVHHY